MYLESKLNQDNIIKAWFFASEAHKEQKYPGNNLPYLTHIGNVMMEVISISYTVENIELAISCAILHDTIEDTNVTYNQLVENFSVEIANGVLALTKNEKLETKHEKILDSLERIKMQPKEVWIVKMADRVSNLREPPHYWTVEKRRTYRHEAQIILEHLSLANELMAKRLKDKIEEYRKYIDEVKK
ncbi:MAG: HD domain-containing protein [Epsilonproteobacteria bacterium]|nr:HD domain-containing protein [Campylobacterota bacterium]